MLIRIRNLLAALWYQLTSRRYRMIKRSRLFDVDYYRRNYPDIDAAGTDPLIHYLSRGFLEQRRPSALFDPSFYNHQVPEIAEQDVNPLVHFLEDGWRRGLRPNLLVDPAYYALNNKDFKAEETDPLSHFLSTSPGVARGWSLSPYFDPSFYCRRYRDAEPLIDDPQAAYRHALETGVQENRQLGLYFDSAYYLDTNPSLEEIGLDPLRHYRTYGAAKKRSPSPVFEPRLYAEAHGVTDCDDLFLHYLLHQDDDRRPCAWFDPAFYRKSYLSVDNAMIPPLKHYLKSGLKDRNYPNEETAQLADKPLISILVPVYNVRHCFLNTCIRSVIYQSYPHWELCLVDDCSSDPAIRTLLETWAAFDSRIKIDFLPQNSGISAATNAAAQRATGSYLAFLDNDDELAPTALQTFATWINEHPAELYYSDEVLVGEDGQHLNVFRKPGYNGELLLSHNYVTHCVLTEKSLFDSVDGCNTALDGAQDHDLFLKLSEKARTIHHLPELLYHWRASEQSTSINHAQKQYADEAGRTSVTQALARRGEAAEVLPTELKFFYRARRRIHSQEPATLVIYKQRMSNKTVPWVKEALAAAGHPVTQLVVASEEHADPSLAESVERETGIDTICKELKKGGGPAAAGQAVLTDINGFYAAFIHDGLSFKSGNWLAALIEHAQSDEVGMVGGRVDYPEAYYDIISPIPDCRNPSPIYYQNFLVNCSVFMNGRHCQQQVRGVHGDLFLLRTDLLRSPYGFGTEDYPYLFAPTDLAFRLHQDGWKNIYTPYCRAAAAQSDFERCRNLPPNALQGEKKRFQTRWRDLLIQGDPFYNPGIVSDSGRSPDDYRRWLCPL